MACYETTYETAAELSALAASPTSAWRSAAIAAYRRTEHERGADLAARIAALTGRRLAPEALVIDRDARRATARVDGALFQLRDRVLVLLRPCAHCGVGRFPSAPIANAGDLGYALAVWEPRCAGCQPADPPEGWDS